MKTLGPHHFTWQNKNITFTLREIFSRHQVYLLSTCLEPPKDSMLRDISPCFLPVVWTCPRNAGEGRAGVWASASQNRRGLSLTIRSFFFLFQLLYLEVLGDCFYHPQRLQGQIFHLVLTVSYKNFLHIYMCSEFLSMKLRKGKVFRYISVNFSKFLLLWDTSS